MYMPPELCMGQHYTQKADVWGVGCMLYELMMLKYVQYSTLHNTAKHHTTLHNTALHYTAPPASCENPDGCHSTAHPVTRGTVQWCRRQQHPPHLPPRARALSRCSLSVLSLSRGG